MKARAFRELMSAVSDLTAHQRQWLSDVLKGNRPAERVADILEHRLPESPSCPFCGEHRSWRWGQAAGLQRYRCQACHHTFNALTGTPLAHLRYKALWLQHAGELAEGHSIRQSATILGVHRNTAFRWRHRFLAWPRQS